MRNAPIVGRHPHGLHLLPTILGLTPRSAKRAFDPDAAGGLDEGGLGDLGSGLQRWAPGLQ